MKNNEIKNLYIVATPIGNINEISSLAINSLKENTHFFCEDTRVTKKLFNLLNISLVNKHFYCFNQNNEEEFIKNFNFASNQYCLLSDAGYPLLSDPGFSLVNHFINNNWNIKVVNGPCSIMHALVVSGFPTQKFIFAGFLNHKEKIKKQELIHFNNYKNTIIIFESIHRIKETLKLIYQIFDHNKKICIARELTKINETIIRVDIKNVLTVPIVEKGEFVIVIDNNCYENTKKENEKMDFKMILNELEMLLKKGEQINVACKMVAYKHNLKKNVVYNFWQQQKNWI
ncbi:MAG: 16S rRNA (cytidine(1402)-2'-O)-methyltransferase [Malacoplasma sp.]|nr:16S rRNA (cytidine(1402)-2'-O)-methyltransferase [Malacoplasma sp.]